MWGMMKQDNTCIVLITEGEKIDERKGRIIPEKK